jgi:hypothetical protein
MECFDFYGFDSPKRRLIEVFVGQTRKSVGEYEEFKLLARKLSLLALIEHEQTNCVRNEYDFEDRIHNGSIDELESCCAGMNVVNRNEYDRMVESIAPIQRYTPFEQMDIFLYIKSWSTYKSISTVIFILDVAREHGVDVSLFVQQPLVNSRNSISALQALDGLKWLTSGYDLVFESIKLPVYPALDPDEDVPSYLIQFQLGVRT